MIDFEKVNILGCGEELEEMKAISDEISKAGGRKIHLVDKIAKLKKDMKSARDEKKAADERGDRRAWEIAFDKIEPLLSEKDRLEEELAGIKPIDLSERYERLRRKVYALESAAEENMKAAKQKREDLKPLRGHLATLLSQISQR